jgi:hypothetical protein
MNSLRTVGARLGMIALLLLIGYVSQANASATLLLEEPYGHLGAFTQTGHAAVYLDRVCADTPTVLRRCADGETGIVISRYDKVGGYDWLAIPLIPYLYAVQTPDNIPLFANPKLVAFLRDQYRRKYLEEIAPDDPNNNGEPPEGNWIQLIGSAYDRTIYGYEIQTSEAQDDNFIREYNSRPNRSHFNLLFHNCADFARGVINFYYPRTLHRNLFTDAGITTPKQMARLMVKFGARHPELEPSSFVIPQVPGSMPRSTPVHGVLESVVKSKKYMAAIVILHPVLAGCLLAGDMGVDRFDPAKHAMVMDSGPELEPPIASTQRRSYEDQLKLLARVDPQLKIRRNQKAWESLQQDAEPELDPEGRPMLKMRVGNDSVDVGVARDNILSTPAPPALTEELLAARLHEELKRGDAPKASQSEVSSDWDLLQQVQQSKVQ